MPNHLFCQAQMASLTSEKTEIPAEYFNFSNVFSSDSAAELPEYTKINDYSINLLNNKQSPYGLIYSLELMELKTLKTYIKANLASGFIKPSKFPSSTPILFVWKKNGSFRLSIDYQGLNNLKIKNCYPLPLIGESFDCLCHVKHFTWLNLINAYHQMRI